MEYHNILWHFIQCLVKLLNVITYFVGFVWNICRHSQCPRHSLWKVSSRLSHLSRRRWGPYKHRYATIIIIVSAVIGMWECFSWERCLLFSAVCLESCLECGLHINHKIIPVRDIWGDFFFFYPNLLHEKLIFIVCAYWQALSSKSRNGFFFSNDLTSVLVL